MPGDFQASGAVRRVRRNLVEPKRIGRRHLGIWQNPVDPDLNRNFMASFWLARP